jgi:ribonuclease D
VSVDIGGTLFVQKPQRYAAKALAELKRKRALVEDEALSRLLAETGVDALLKGAPDEAEDADADEDEGDDEENDAEE